MGKVIKYITSPINKLLKRIEEDNNIRDKLEKNIKDVVSTLDLNKYEEEELRENHKKMTKKRLNRVIDDPKWWEILKDKEAKGYYGDSEYEQKEDVYYSYLTDKIHKDKALNKEEKKIKFNNLIREKHFEKETTRNKISEWLGVLGFILVIILFMLYIGGTMLRYGIPAGIVLILVFGLLLFL